MRGRECGKEEELNNSPQQIALVENLIVVGSLDNDSAPYPPPAGKVQII